MILMQSKRIVSLMDRVGADYDYNHNRLHFGVIIIIITSYFKLIIIIIIIIMGYNQLAYFQSLERCLDPNIAD